MSVDIHGGRFLQGSPAGLPVAVIESAFAGLIGSVEPDAFMLKLEGAGGVDTPLFLRVQQEETNSFSIARPVEDPRLYRALLTVAKHEGVVVHAPESPPIIAHGATVEHLPEDMISALGSAVFVTTPEQLRHALFGPWIQS